MYAVIGKENMNMEYCLDVRDLTKKFQGRTVVDHLSFQVKRGEVFGILGHNGAGKTTAIETILGLHQPEEGIAYIMGKEARKERKSLFQHIGVQLQASSYPNHIKVKEVCEEIAALYDQPEDYLKLLQQFGLKRYLLQKVEKLSGGERQKLSIIEALISKPDLIFLDELTTGLDVAARRSVWEILEGLKQQGMTMILTTHYMEEAQYLCDRILLMKQGKAIQMGTIQEIVNNQGYHNLEEAYLSYMKEELK